MRTSGRENNRRAIENLIKAGALDTLDGNRRQMTMIFPSLVDKINNDKKMSMAGQMTLFDIAAPEEKEDFELRMPDVEEFDRELFLNFEKEVLGVYLSGHPLEGYLDVLQKNTTALSREFMYRESDEFDGQAEEGMLEDGKSVVIGGMITSLNTKYTKNNQMMAFLMLEDLVGTVEVVVFPRVFEEYREALAEDKKVLILGRVQAEEEKDAKLIAQEIREFNEAAKELWVQFPSKEDYFAAESGLLDLLRRFDGNDDVVVYLSRERAVKRFPKNCRTSVELGAKEALEEAFGAQNIKVIQKNIEFRHKRY